MIGIVRNKTGTHFHPAAHPGGQHHAGCCLAQGDPRSPGIEGTAGLFGNGMEGSKPADDKAAEHIAANDHRMTPGTLLQQTPRDNESRQS